MEEKGYYYVELLQRPIAKSNMYGVRVVGKPPKQRGIIYTTRELEDYEILIGKLVEQVIPKTIDSYTSLYVRIYQHGKKWIDIDNCFKAIQDGMDSKKTIKRGQKDIRVCETGMEDDKLFQLIIGERIHVENAEEQRVEIIVEDYKGLFHLVDTVRSHYNLPHDYVGDLLLPDLKK